MTDPIAVALIGLATAGIGAAAKLVPDAIKWVFHREDAIRAAGDAALKAKTREIDGLRQELEDRDADCRRQLDELKDENRDLRSQLREARRP